MKKRIMFEQKFNLKLIKLVFFLHFDVLLKENRREETFGSSCTYNMTLYNIVYITRNVIII